MVATTTLKLPEALKIRIAKLAEIILVCDCVCSKPLTFGTLCKAAVIATLSR